MKEVDVKTLQEWLSDDSVTVVDVRRSDEYMREHIPETINIPLDVLSEESISGIKTDKIVMQCNTGGRSARGCVAVEGVETKHDVYSLKGGIEAWKAAGEKTVKTKRGIRLPLHRQVQIGAGSLVAIGVVLGYLISPAFYGLSLFVGLGLLNAGITGWCGMGKFLSKAPWNKVSK